MFVTDVVTVSCGYNITNERASEDVRARIRSRAEYIRSRVRACRRRHPVTGATRNRSVALGGTARRESDSGGIIIIILCDALKKRLRRRIFVFTCAREPAEISTGISTHQFRTRIFIHVVIGTSKLRQIGMLPRRLS